MYVKRSIKKKKKIKAFSKNIVSTKNSNFFFLIIKFL